MPRLQRSTTSLLAALAWLGTRGTGAIAALVVFGIALPPLGEMLRPYVTEAVFLLLCISFMRVDPAALLAHLKRPALVLGATVWTTLAVPLVIGLATQWLQLKTQSPGLHLGLMLQAVASPMMASPSLAAIMGLDAALVLIALIASTAVVPFTAALFASLFFGDVLSLAPLTLGLKLLAMLAGSLLVGFAIRRLFGAEAIARNRAPIDGVNVILLFVFVAAVMGNVVASFLADPPGVLLLTALAFAMFFGLLAATMLIFRGAGMDRALALGLMVSQRNMGLMLAATDGVLPGATWLYFALSQFPIYLSPAMLKPLADAVAGRRRGPA